MKADLELVEPPVPAKEGCPKYVACGLQHGEDSMLLKFCAKEAEGVEYPVDCYSKVRLTIAFH